VKLNEGGYIDGSSLQSTKDKRLALTSKARAERNLELTNGKGVIEKVGLDINKKCLVGDLAFGFGDAYSLISKTGAIIHETTKFIYTIKIDDQGQPIGGTVEKHKRSDINTRDLKSGKGISCVDQ